LGSFVPSAGARDELVEVLRGEIAHLRRESERKDTIIMSLSQANAEQARTIREIEAPSEADERGSPEADEDEQDGGTPRPDAPGAQEGARRPWWRRVFGT
jgi:hypothetical protein